jgi:hypothetical protein
MSVAFGKNITPIPVMNKGLIFDATAKVPVKLGPKLFTPSIYSTTQYAANGNGTVVFVAQPPDMVTAMDKNVYIKWYVDLLFACTATSTNSNYCLDLGSLDAPRWMPVSQCMSTIQVSINGNSDSIQPQYCINAFSRCNMINELTSRQMSLSPCALDEYQNYDQATRVAPPAVTGAGFDINQCALKGSVADPLQSFGESVGKYSANRGSWPIQILQNTLDAAHGPGTAHVRFSVCEPLWVSPFDAVSDGKSLIGINQFQVNVTLQGNLAYAWSHSNSAAASQGFSVVGSLYQPPELHVNWLTPSALSKIPPIMVVPYSHVDVYQRDAVSGALAPFATAYNTTTASVTLSAVPDRIIAFAARPLAPASLPNVGPGGRSVTTTDTFFNIYGLRVNFDNNSGQLSQATEEDLYMESLKNGLQMSFTQWHTTIGSVFILDAAQNLALTKAEEAPGVSLRKQLQLYVDLKNINPTDTITPTLWMLVISSGILTITKGAAIPQSQVLTESDVLLAAEQSTVMTMQVANTFYGSGFKKIFDNLHKVHDVLHRAKPLSAVLSAAKSSGFDSNPAFKIAQQLQKVSGYGLMGKDELKKRAFGVVNDDEEEDDVEDASGNYQRGKRLNMDEEEAACRE